MVNLTKFCLKKLINKILNRKISFIILILVSVSCYGQQDSNYVRKTPISGSLSTSIGKVGYWNAEKQQSVQGVNYGLTLSVGFYLGYHYSLGFAFNIPVNQSISKYLPWSPDYSFIITRNKYIPNTFYWGYSNYGNNKYASSINVTGQNLASGNFFIGYYPKISDSIMRYLKIFPSSKLSPSIQINYAIKYRDINGNYSGSVFLGKPAISFNLKYIIINNFFISGSISYFIRQKLQLPWDSDYSYAFGFENWAPWKFSFTYAKYTNRFPWITQSLSSNSGFLNGTFSLSFNYSINYKKHIKN